VQTVNASARHGDAWEHGLFLAAEALVRVCVTGALGDQIDGALSLVFRIDSRWRLAVVGFLHLTVETRTGVGI